MTFIIALRWGNGILVTADTRVSSFVGIMREERKVFPIVFYKNGEEYDLALVAGSGDAAIIKQNMENIQKIFGTWFTSLQKPRNPKEDEIEEIVEEIENYLINRYSQLEKVGIKPETNMLLATVTQEGNPKLYRFDDRGLCEPLHDNPGYALIGSGTLTGGLLLLKLFDYDPIKFVGDRGLFSSFLIDCVSEVDTSVSPFTGDSFYIRWDENKKKVVMGPLSPEWIKEFKEKSALRKRLIPLFWFILDKLGEEKIIDSWKELVKQIKDEKIRNTIKEMIEKISK
jgi:hypothetical protein